MALAEIGARALSNRLPKLITPRTHAIIDYATAGTFFLMSGLLWKRHKRAAIAALACGVHQTTHALVTDHPGGVAGVVSFPTHGKLETGFAGIVTSLPNLLGFSDSWPALYFRSQGMAIAAAAGMTNFSATGHRHGHREFAA
jgi:short subunit fatty acids transporter